MCVLFIFSNIAFPDTERVKKTRRYESNRFSHILSNFLFRCKDD